MTLTSCLEARTLYHVSVGVDVWMPSASVTYVRRGPTLDGPLVAQLEYAALHIF
jgi:hypothetical protein